MVIYTGKSEKDFLKELALRQFNTQYQKNILVENCEIISIRANYGADLGYEISTKRADDYLRLRIYMSFQMQDSVGAYRLEVDNTKVEGHLGDEVRVALGSLNREWYENGIYRFSWIGVQFNPARTLLSMAGEPIMSMSGEVIESVGQ